MADLVKCLDLVLESEGGYQLHTVSGDRGGMTYAGISRNNWPKWSGWRKIDLNDMSGIVPLVYDFYYQNFWNKIKGDDIIDQDTAYLIFDFAVNAGIKSAVRLAQHLIKVQADGVIGPITIRALNLLSEIPMGENLFCLNYSLGRVYFYSTIAGKDKRRKRDVIYSNMKFLPGWINRIKKSLENTSKL